MGKVIIFAFVHFAPNATFHQLVINNNKYEKPHFLYKQRTYYKGFGTLSIIRMDCNYGTHVTQIKQATE